MIYDIVDCFKFESDIEKYCGYLFSSSGNKKMKSTTEVLELLVNCSYGNQSWVPLKEIKESKKIEVK